MPSVALLSKWDTQSSYPLVPNSITPLQNLCFSAGSAAFWRYLSAPPSPLASGQPSRPAPGLPQPVPPARRNPHKVASLAGLAETRMALEAGRQPTCALLPSGSIERCLDRSGRARRGRSSRKEPSVCVCVCMCVCVCVRACVRVSAVCVLSPR